MESPVGAAAWPIAAVTSLGPSNLPPSKTDRVKVEVGDLLLYETWGGGGCGDPLERDPALVLFDVEAGLVTVAGARSYGVVNPNDRVDSAETAELRARMAKERGKAPLFDRGFANIDELKARCRSETGLPPPAAPRFSALTRARAKSASGKQRSHA